MKPFDIEAAKRGEPVCTADGREVKLYAFDAPRTRTDCAQQPILGVVRAGKDLWFIATWFHGGNSRIDRESHDDLRMAPRKETRWVVTWRCAGSRSVYSDAFDDEVSARNVAFNIGKEPHRHSFSNNAIEVDV